MVDRAELASLVETAKGDFRHSANEEDIFSYLNAGVQALNSGDSQKANLYFEQSKSKFGDGYPNNYLQAIALARMNRWEEAIVALKPLTISNDSHPKVRQLYDQLNQRSMGQAQLKTKGTQSKQKTKYFGSSLLTPTTLVKIATSLEIWNQLLSFHHLLASDEYIQFLDNYYRQSLQCFGAHWHYLDISNVLFTASKSIQPKKYLEIGVRRGRSACVVARGCPTVDIFAFDMWIPEYAGMPNPGPDFVQSELKQHGHQGKVAFFNGNSHNTLPEFFGQYPDFMFDLITVDGDHSEQGAWDDLSTVIPHLSKGGVIVFDDISHPAHPYLLKVWRKALDTYPFLSGFEYTEKGYGVAFAIRQD